MFCTFHNLRRCIITWADEGASTGLVDMSWVAADYCAHLATETSSGTKLQYDCLRSYKFGTNLASYKRTSFLVECNTAQAVNTSLPSLLTFATKLEQRLVP